MAPKKKKEKGDAVKGEKLFANLCSVCHSMASNSVGPALGVAYGNNIASADGFSYSGALQAKATLKWTDTNLDKWLTAPSAFAPGNAMAFAGMPSGKDRKDIIAFLAGS